MTSNDLSGRPAPAIERAAADQHWHRLHPLSPLVRAGRSVFALVVAFVFRLIAQRRQDVGTSIIDAIVVVVVLVLGLVSWLVTRWQVSDGVLRVETGLLRRSSQRYPLSQVQAIDVVQTGLARVLGLAELRLRMAGGASRGGGRLQCVKASDAEPLKARLLALAHGHAEDTAAPPAEELLQIPTGRLLGSVLLSGLGLASVLGVAGLLSLGIAAPSTAAAALSSSGAVVVALGGVVYRRINGEYRQTVALAPDGFHVRSGLVETTTETIPVDRVQAVRIVEPLLWRPMGWCRLEVEVAGKKVREENHSEGRQRRALLPVGSKVLAGQLLDTLVPGAPPADQRTVARAKWKAPLTYHWLAYGRNDRCAVTCGGRIRRVYHWVPLAKVQSIRRVQGPIQRIFGLGSVHLDTAGRSLHAVLKDRDWADVERELAELPDLCREARRSRWA
jgi:putative membrane protein